jgi:energy-coupling factor transport system permease protein
MILSLIIFLITILITNNIWLIILILSLTIIIRLLNNISIIDTIKDIWNIKILLVTYILIAYLSKTNNLVIIITTLKTIIIVLYTSYIVKVMKVFEMTSGLESVLKPFKSIIPVKEFALVITLAFKFIPTLITSTKKILKSLTNRGRDYKKASLKEKFLIIEAIITPIFNKTFRISDRVSDALILKHYSLEEDRIKNKEDIIAKKDILYLLGHIILLIIAVGVRIYEIFINSRI